MSTEKNFEALATKAPSDLHENFAQWIYEKTGVRVDTKTVQLACSLRMDFQSSPENQSHLAERKAEAARRKKASAAAKKAKLEAQLAKLKADLEKVEEPEAPASMPAKKAVAKKPEAESKPEAPAKAPVARKPRVRKTAAVKAAEAAAAEVPADFDADDLEERPEPVKRARRTRRPAAKTA